MTRFVSFVPSVLQITLLVALMTSPAASAAEAASQPDYEFELKEVWIPMPDGVRLAADLYLPKSADPDEVFPVVLEYDPYRKDESRSGRYSLYSYFAARGYIVARVDIRGTGRSEGRLIPHEYSDQELDDGEKIIEWLSEHEQSNGNVGMFGISWSGFNSIQLASRNPAALKAIIPIDATEDLFQDDVHYMDGIMHMDSWEMSQDLYNSLPAAPEYVLDEDYFKNRFDTDPWMLTYKNQQRDGKFWDRASVRDRYESIRIPSFHIGGWYDGYRDSLPRMLENVKAPVKAMIGAWSHAWPNEPYPAPGMEWRHEAVRWFDYWLKGKDTGIMDEPALAVYVRDWHPPGPYLDYAPGHWRYEDGWPIERIDEQTFYFNDNHTLAKTSPGEAVHQLKYVPSSGLEAGGPVMWWGDVAHDQRPSDAFSLVYDSEPLEEELEILGLPTAVLQVMADAPHANWFVRLSDVAPDGEVTLITGAGFNGAHRNSAREPQALTPGAWFPLNIEMHFTSWVFPKKHRIRMSISNAQWPMLWPTPYPMTTSLQLGGTGASHVVLPRVPPGSVRTPAFLPIEEPEQASGFASLDPGTPSGYGEIETVERNKRTGEARVVLTNGGSTQYPWGLETYRENIEHRTSDPNPERTSVVGSYELEMKLEGRVLLWQAESSFTSDAENFYYEFVRRVSENGELIRSKTWKQKIPRDHQ
jgi:putative CocE/NonD family hydrolase